MKHFAPCALVVCCAVALGGARRSPYNTAFKGYSDDKLNVHLVSHTHGTSRMSRSAGALKCTAGEAAHHADVVGVPTSTNMHAPRTTDDVGWLKTLDEYYAVGARFLQRAFPLARELALLFAVATYTQGANNSIQHAAVQFILDSVVNELPRNPDRKFIYVEQAFFQHWWFDQDDETRAQVRELVLAGQLEFTNAGWDMHDEANPTYIDMIDQTTLGNRFLLRELGVVPKVTWQIDPFGHSAAQQSLLTALSGYDALYAARIDYQDKAVRAASRSLETIWRASPSLGAGAQSLFGTLYYHYCPPPGLNFDVSNPHATPVSVDPRLEGLQPDAQAILNTFLEDAREQASAYQGNHIMFTMGCDFQYEQVCAACTMLAACVAGCTRFSVRGMRRRLSGMPTWMRSFTS